MDKIDNLLAECRSWDDFWDRAVAQSTTTQKGKLFERLTQLYLLTKPEYQTRLKSVWNAAVDLPDKIRRKLDLPDTDEGIDLIAETRDGEFWAIQCKFRKDTSKALTRGELSTFTSLAFVSCKDKFTLAVVAHTCAHPVKKQKLMGNTVEIGLERWLEIDEDGWKRIRAELSGHHELPEKRKPRPHQKDAIRASKKHFRSKKVSRGRMIMPCGTGKSLTAFWVAQALKDVNTILVAVPSLALIKQSLADWTREYLAHGQVPEWLCVCSDETVGKLDQDEFMTGTYDLGIDTTTDANKIAKFLSKKTDNPKIVFSTYQSGLKLAEGTRKARCEFDLAIMDEAHKTVGKKVKLFASLLHDENVPIKRRLFMTATERVVQASSDDVLSMDSEEDYGKRFYQLTFKEAIEANPPIISDYKIVTIAVTDERLAEMIEQNELIIPEGASLEEQDAQSLAAGVALREAVRKHGVQHAISFHRSIKAASAFSDQQNALSKVEGATHNIEAVHVSSKRSAGERAALMKQFREADYGLVTNARCLTEGVDVPSVDCVMFADPKNSVVDIVQAAGRALRIYPGKKFGYIMLPVVVEKGMSFEDYMETTPFKQIARVITALSTQDDRIAEQFRARGSSGEQEGRIVGFEVDVSVGTKIDLAALYEKIDTKIWERLSKANWRPFKEARIYARNQGFESVREWFTPGNAVRLPRDIPLHPNKIYQNTGWESYSDWLFLPFEEAREFVRSLNFVTEDQWLTYANSGKLPSGVPRHPNEAYKNSGWVDYYDWIGFDGLSFVDRLPFVEARKFARSVNVKSEAEWSFFVKSGMLPYGVPARPDIEYRDKGWKSYEDWLFLPFELARKYVRSLNLSMAKWRKFYRSSKLPNDIPMFPAKVYQATGWINDNDWLGCEPRPFEEARQFARSLNLNSRHQWRVMAQKKNFPNDIPTNPHLTYEHSWINYSDWLHTGKD
jgi:superfamily II DNA or RNA helicase